MQKRREDKLSFSGFFFTYQDKGTLKKQLNLPGRIVNK